MPTILHTEASLGLGGQELRILAETRWLRDHGWGALVACQPGSGLLAEAQAAGVDAVAVRMRGAADLGALWALRRLMRAHAVSLVHTHSSTDSWLGALAARSLRLPVVRSRHVSIAIRSALVYRLADRIVTSGEVVRALVVAAGIPPHRAAPIPPGAATPPFHPTVSGTARRHERGREPGARPRRRDGAARPSRGPTGTRRRGARDPRRPGARPRDGARGAGGGRGRAHARRVHDADHLGVPHVARQLEDIEIF